MAGLRNVPFQGGTDWSEAAPSESTTRAPLRALGGMLTSYGISSYGSPASPNSLPRTPTGGSAPIAIIGGTVARRLAIRGPVARRDNRDSPHYRNGGGQNRADVNRERAENTSKLPPRAQKNPHFADLKDSTTEPLCPDGALSLPQKAKMDRQRGESIPSIRPPGSFRRNFLRPRKVALNSSFFCLCPHPPGNLAESASTLAHTSISLRYSSVCRIFAPSSSRGGGGFFSPFPCGLLL